MVKHSMDVKALKQDAYRDAMFELLDVVYKRKGLFISAGVFLVVIVGLILGYFGYSSYQDRLASESFYQADKVYLNKATPEKKRLGEAKTAFHEFLESFPQSRMSPIAWMKLAKISWQEKDLDGAEKAFQKVIDHSESSSFKRNQAILGMAKLKEMRGEYDASKELIQNLPDESFADVKALSLGRLAIAQNQNGEAKKHLEELSKRVPPDKLSEWAKDAMSVLP